MTEEQIITVENCNQLCREISYNESGDASTKSAAWVVVYNFCKQNGLPKNDGTIIFSGIEQVINFIQSLIDKK